MLSSIPSGLQASGPAFLSIAIMLPGFHFLPSNLDLASAPSFDFLIISIIASMFDKAIVRPS